MPAERESISVDLVSSEQLSSNSKRKHLDALNVDVLRKEPRSPGRRISPSASPIPDVNVIESEVFRDEDALG